MRLIHAAAFAAAIVLSAALIAGAAMAQSFSADDFLPPAQSDNPEAPLEVKDPGAVKATEGEFTGKPAVEAATAQDAINAFIQGNAFGFAEVRFPSGFGFAAKGVATYTVHPSNTATRIEQRLAYNIAYLNAKRYLAEGFFGLSNEGRTKLASFFTNLDTSERTMVDISETTTESIAQVVSGMMRGYVVYDVRDDFQNHVVHVVLVATPKTMGYFERPDPSTIVAESIRDGLNQVLTEIKRNIVPPVGGRTVFVPATGEMAYVGFGSDVIRQNSNPALQARQTLNAQKSAGLRAKDALCGIIVGDNIRSEEYEDTSAETRISDFDKVAGDDPLNAADFNSAGAKALAETRQEFLNAQTNTTLITSVRKGVLPPGVQTSGWVDEDNTFAYSLAIWLPSAVKRGEGMRDLMRNSDIQGGTGAAGPAATGPEVKQGPTGQVQSDDAL